MTHHQFQIRLLVGIPLLVLLVWSQDLLNAELTSIVFLAVATVGVLLALLDIRARKNSHHNPQDNSIGTKE